jgi:AraC-like DNA-binding protein
VVPDLVTLPNAFLPHLAKMGLDVPQLLERAQIARVENAKTRVHEERVHVGALEGAKRSRTRVTTTQFFAFWEVLEQHSTDPAFGLELGAQAVATRLDVGIAAALCASTFGEAIRMFGRFKRLVCPEDVSLEVEHGEAALRFRWLLAEDHPPRMLTDTSFATVLALGRHGTGKRIVPRRVELTRRRANEGLLSRYFECPVRFGQENDAIVFDAHTLDEPFGTHNEKLLAEMLPQLESALAENAEERTLPGRVRTVIGRTMRSRRPSVQAVAKAMSMSPRTLQRRLGETGTTFQELLDTVRKHTARRLLATTELDPGEIAFFLGFEEVNSFSRAFHVWEGTTPARWRRDTAGGSA